MRGRAEQQEARARRWPRSSSARRALSDDNPFSEAQFKTLKYRPEFPARFGSSTDARGFCQVFFPWYNSEHHHSGIGLLTPEDVHLGRAATRAEVLALAHAAHPERFVRGVPQPAAAPTAVWINPPKPLPEVRGENIDLVAPRCRSTPRHREH